MDSESILPDFCNDELDDSHQNDENQERPNDVTQFSMTRDENVEFDIDIKEEVGELFMGGSMDEENPQFIFPAGHILVQDNLIIPTPTWIVSPPQSQRQQLSYAQNHKDNTLPGITTIPPFSTRKPSILQKKTSMNDTRNIQSPIVLPRIANFLPFSTRKPSILQKKNSMKDTRNIQSPISPTISSTNYSRIVESASKDFRITSNDTSPTQPMRDDSTTTHLTRMTSGQNKNKDLDIEIIEEVGELFVGSSMDEENAQLILPTGHILIQDNLIPTPTCIVSPPQSQRQQLSYAQVYKDNALPGIINLPPFSRRKPLILQKKNSMKEAGTIQSPSSLTILSNNYSKILESSTRRDFGAISTEFLSTQSTNNVSTSAQFQSTNMIRLNAPAPTTNPKNCEELNMKKTGSNHVFQDRVTTHTGGKYYKCTVPECNKLFTSILGFKYHVELHVKGPNCGKCGETLVSTAALKRHMKIHTWKRKRIHNCTEPGCEKRFPYISLLKLHMATHTGERKYRCAVPGCDKTYTSNSNVKAHAATHTGERKYRCAVPGCDKTYTSNLGLKRHVETHTGEGKKKCAFPGCDKSYTYSTTLRSHMKTHDTGKKEFESDDCDT